VCVYIRKHSCISPLWVLLVLGIMLIAGSNIIIKLYHKWVAAEMVFVRDSLLLSERSLVRSFSRRLNILLFLILYKSDIFCRKSSQRHLVRPVGNEEYVFTIKNCNTYNTTPYILVVVSRIENTYELQRTVLVGVSIAVNGYGQQHIHVYLRKKNCNAYWIRCSLYIAIRGVLL
jgi:hypothetical protein